MKKLDIAIAVVLAAAGANLLQAQQMQGGQPLGMGRPYGQINQTRTRPNLAGTVNAQMQADPNGLQLRRPTLADTSWTYIAPEPAREFSRHDRVFISVSETARSTAEADVQRRKNAIYDAVLQEWVRFVSLLTLKPAVQRDGDLSVSGQLNQTYRAEADTEQRESIQLKITAEVADILPNGHLVLEAHKRIRVNNSVFEVSLSGICDPRDVGTDDSVRSERIRNLQLERRNRGVERDATRRGFITLFMDEFNPF